MRVQPVTTAESNLSVRPGDTFTSEIEVVKVVYQLHQLQRLHAEGNGQDTAAPSTHAIERAVEWIKDMHYDALTTGEEWLKPHVSIDEDGDVAFEWWKGDRKLTVYVSPETAEYIKVERPAATSDLMDGRIETNEDRRELWHWLTSQS